MIEKKWIGEKEVEAMTGRKLQTLRNDRFLGQGLPYTKMGKSVRYSVEDVLAYMEARRVSTSDAPRRNEDGADHE